MTAFAYRAARSDGAVVKGMLDAATVPDAASLLSARGLYLIALKPAPAERRWLRRPSARALATVYQSLATLVEAGVPLERALVVTARAASGILRHAIDRAAQCVREGGSLAAALAAEPALASPVALGLVRAGERGVGLGPALAQAGLHLERAAETEARLRAQLAYPALLAVVGSLSVGVIVLFVIPRFATLLSDVGQALPPATRILIGAADLVRRFWVVIGAGGVGLGVAAVTQIRRRRAAWHEFLLGLPLVGAIRHGLATARVARTLGALLGTGTPALTALAVAREAAGDEAIAARLADAQGRVAEGQGLTAALEATRAVTATAVQLAAIGESSSRLPVLLAKAADLEEQAAERRLHALAGFLEPALIVAFAGLVAFVAAALLQAVYALRP